jgi:large subunit ribosomal protein L13
VRAGQNVMSTKSYTPKASEIERRWYVIDADGKTLGRLCSAVARVLMGKHKPTYAAHLDSGDFVIVVNADRAVLTGSKEGQKMYYRHSGQPGQLKQETAAQLRRRKPERMVELAVRGMLPKNKIGRHLYRKLKVYAGPEHPHAAQTPEPLESLQGAFR